MTSRMTDALLGLVFFGALIGLGLATIVLSDFKWGAKRYEVEILSPDVGYLQTGDPVLLFGMPSGKVIDVRRLPEPLEVTMYGGRVETCKVAIDVRLDVDMHSQLPEDSRLVIEDRGLLGGKLIRVISGNSPMTVEPGQPLVALNAISALQSAGEIIAENREPVRRAVEAAVQMLEQGNRQGGLLGALLWDESLADDVKGAAAGAREVTDGLRRGEGTLGKLFRDDSLYEDGQVAMSDVQGFFDSAREVADKIRSGEGTIGRLVYSDEAHDGLTALTAKLEGDDSILGMLLTDEEMARKFRAIVNQVLGAVEDARETSPVQGVGSFLFGTF